MPRSTIRTPDLTWEPEKTVVSCRANFRSTDNKIEHRKIRISEPTFPMAILEYGRFFCDHRKDLILPDTHRTILSIVAITMTPVFGTVDLLSREFKKYKLRTIEKS